MADLPRDLERVIDRARAACSRVPAGRQLLSPIEVDDGMRRALERYSGGTMHARLEAWARAWTWEAAGAALIGTTGAGKTTAAAALVRRLLSEARRSDDAMVRRRAESIRWVSGYEIANASQRPGLNLDLIERCRLARLLVIDDLGWEETRGSKLPEIIHERHELKFPTVVTTGLELPELEARYGAAMLRRVLQAAGRGKLVNLYVDPNGKAGQ